MGKDPDEIREQIEETRGRMSETVDAIAYKADVPNRMQDAVNDRVSSVKSTISGTIGMMRDRVGDVRQRMGDVQQRMGDVQQRMGAVRDRVSGAMPDPEDLQRVTMTTIDRVRENPLGVFFGAAAVGFLFGSLLPATDIENERLGQISDQLKQTAQATGGQIIAQSKAVMRDTIEAAKDAATQSAMERGQDVAQTAIDGMQARQSGL